MRSARSCSSSTSSSGRFSHPATKAYYASLGCHARVGGGDEGNLGREVSTEVPRRGRRPGRDRRTPEGLCERREPAAPPVRGTRRDWQDDLCDGPRARHVRRDLAAELLRAEQQRRAGDRDRPNEGEGECAARAVRRGDLKAPLPRRAVNSLQVAASLGATIDADVLYKVASTIRPEEVKKLIEKALEGEFLRAREVLDRLLIEYGLSGEDIVRQLHRTVFDLNVPDESKVRLLDRIGETDFRLTEGSSERIQIEALLAHFALIGQELNKK